MVKKILIVGAGIAGLSAGVHALRNGYEVEIFEKHDLPGGLCTSWERKGYTFDGCIHRLTGTRPDSQFNRLWREIGALKDVEIIFHDPFMSVENGSGEPLHIFSNLDRLEEHLLQKYPEDRMLIRELSGAARVFAGARFPLEKPDELYKIWDFPVMLVRMMPLFKVMGKFSRTSIAEYFARAKSNSFREAFGLIMPPGYSMISLISTLASLHNRDAGFPRGGSLQFARSIEKRFHEWGGIVNYGCPVKEIRINNGRAVGLLLEKGEEVSGDIVISAADLHHTAYELLGGQYLTPLIKKSFRHFPLYSSVRVSLGIEADLSAEASCPVVRLDIPINAGGEENRYLYLTNYSFDHSLAPAGKAVVGAALYSPYDYWRKEAGNESRYEIKKEQLAEQVITVVEKRFPPARGKIEAMDVVTPVTYERYTNVYKGAYMSWIVPPEEGRFKIPKELPGLKDFYQIGQWIEPPAGLPGSMLTGRHVVQLICSRDGKPFQAS
ncbi:MAG: NAD(P)/FAD-dependent oxidoreductase [Bacillota bacterium]